MTDSMKWILVVALLLLTSSPVQAQTINPMQEALAVLRTMSLVPTVDGIISEEEWQDAARIPGVVALGSGNLDPRMAICWVGSDGKRLYFAVKSELPPVGQLNARVRKKDGPVWHDDSIEIWLAPPRSARPGDTSVIQMIGNPLDTIFDAAFVPGGSQAPWDGDWHFKNTQADGWWHAEASVSLESLGCTAEDLKHEWRVNVCRSWDQPRVYAGWAPMTGSFSNLSTMARVRWDDSAPHVQVISLGKDIFAGNVDVAVEVRNPTDQPVDVAVELLLQPAFFQLMTRQKTLTLAPGTKETMRIGGNMDARKHDASIRVTSADGSTVYLQRAISWDKRPQIVWRVGEHEAKAVDLVVAYYPYLRKLRADIDVSGLTAADAIRKAVVTITREGADDVLARGELANFEGRKGRLVIDTPDLPSGTYMASLKLEANPGAAGASGVPGESFTQKFRRKVFEWEHNKLGTSRVVVPPFTPLEVNGNTVACLLRSHEMNDHGMWNQVISRDEPILAGPIRFEASAGGKAVAWKSQKLKFTETSPDRVVSEASFAGPPVKVSVKSEIDYDGMMKVELVLDPQGDGQIDSLDLIIPVKDEIAKLMHACVDGVLVSPAQAVPDGQGVVWDSSKTLRSNTYGTWIPYLWIGGEERGVCFFSDNDCDWVLDDEKIAIDLLRTDGTVSLRAHLINTPTKLTRQHRIVFGIQATPVKPLPEGWRKRDFYSDYPPGQAEPFTFLFSGTVWGGLDDFHSLYPIDKDFTVWAKMQEARKTGNIDREFVDKWQNMAKERGVSNWNALFSGFSQSIRPNIKVINYIDPRNGVLGEESDYFQHDGFHMEPTPTWRDMAIFYVNKMFEYGFDGVFLDEVYLRANFDTVSGGAYGRDDGNVQPSVGLFSLRAFSKRIATLCHERGIPNYTVDHMTSSNVIPARAFSNMQMDWEAAYGGTDFQTRFSPEYLRAQSIGLQAGLVPIGFGGIYADTDEEKVRLSRTEFGVAQVHEIKVVNDGRTRGLGTYYAKLYAFGYGQPDCKVYRYWEPQPLRADGPTNKALIMSRPGKTMILLTDYSGSGGELTLTPDTKVLGLPSGFAAKDAETGEALAVQNSAVRLTLNRHDFRLIILE